MKDNEQNSLSNENIPEIIICILLMDSAVKKYYVQIWRINK